MPGWDRTLRLIAPPFITLIFLLWTEANTQGGHLYSSMVNIKELNVLQLFGTSIALICMGTITGAVVSLLFRRFPLDVEATFNGKKFEGEYPNVYTEINSLLQYGTELENALYSHDHLMYWGDKDSALSAFRMVGLRPEVTEWIQRRAHQVWIGASTSVLLFLLLIIEAVLILTGKMKPIEDGYFLLSYMTCGISAFVFLASSKVGSHEIRAMTLYCLERPNLLNEPWRPKPEEVETESSSTQSDCEANQGKVTTKRYVMKESLRQLSGHVATAPSGNRTTAKVSRDTLCLFFCVLPFVAVLLCVTFFTCISSQVQIAFLIGMLVGACGAIGLVVACGNAKWLTGIISTPRH